MATRQKPQGHWRHAAALVVGNVALALGPWSVRLADCGPVSAGFWRLALALPVLLVLAVANGQRLLGFDRRVLWALAVAGAVYAADLASWHVGIPRTRLANATLFGNCSSLILMVWALSTARRWPRPSEWAALVATLVGAGILLGRSLQLSTRTLAGDLFCLLAGVFYVFYLVLLRDARGTIGNWAGLTIVSAWSAPLLLVTALALGEPFWPGATHLGVGLGGLAPGKVMHGGWPPLVALALGSQVIGQGCLVYALPRFSALIIGLALMIQPAVAVMVGWLAFGEALTVWDGLGVVLVGSALVLAKLGEG